jgi:large subunit ribosomal protein L16
MAMMPKRVKFRKSQRGKMRGNATRGNTVAFGEYGLQSLEACWVTARQIEAGRVACMHFLRREGRVFIRISRTSRFRVSRWKREWARERVSRNTGVRW